MKFSSLPMNLMSLVNMCPWTTGLLQRQKDRGPGSKCLGT